MRRSLLMAIALLFVNFAYAKSVKINGVKYQTYNGDAHVTEIDSKLTEVHVLAEVNIGGQNYKVVQLFWSGFDPYYKRAFNKENCPSLKTIVIDGPMEEVPPSFFAGISHVEKIVLPSAVTKIGYAAFRSCSGLKTIELPNTVETIDRYAFENCVSLKEVKFPNTLKVIGSYAFHECSNLHSVEIPGSVVSIGSNCFSGCKALESVWIANGVREIGDEAFQGCLMLRDVMLPNECNLASYVFKSCRLVENVMKQDGTSQNGQYPLYYSFSSSCPYYKNQGQNADPNFGKVLASNTPQSIEPAPVHQKAVHQMDDSVDKDVPATGNKCPNTFAVIIGNEKYQQVAEVPYANNDARIFAEYCKKTLGVPVQNVRSYENVTYGMMLSALSDIRAIAEAYNGDIDVIFYYAGHGVPNEASRDAYLLPVDADGRQTEACYPVSRLYQELGGLGARNVVVFMDACFSGSQRGDGMLASARGVAIKAKNDAPQGNMVVFSAAQGDETAYPFKEKGHGLFTYFLLKKLQESRGDCTLGELGDYIQQNVRQQAVVVNRKSQTPTITPSQTIADSWRSLRLR